LPKQKVKRTAKAAKLQQRRERERERTKLQSDISNLEGKPSKTVKEEAELEKKKQRLKELEEKDKTNTSQAPKNQWENLAFLTIMLSILIVFIVYFI